MMQDLIARLEKATGPDQELDARITAYLDLRPEWARSDARTLHAYETKHIKGQWYISLGKNGPGIDFLPLTGSFDAARTLVPEGFYWLVSEGRTRATEPLGGAQIFRPTYLVEPIAEAEHESAIIALCIAALKARSAS